jgi:hypothetical protein
MTWKRVIDFPAVQHAAAWGLLGLVMVMTVGPVTLRPATWLGPDIERFAAFFVLGVIFSLIYPKRLVFVCTLIIFSCGLSEYAQQFMPNRHADLDNFLIKVVGAAGGVAGAKVFR